MILTIGTTPALQRTMFFEHLTIDEVNRATRTYDSAAGKGVNVARVAHVLGAEVLATGFQGGNTGQFCKTYMDREGVRHDFVETAAATRICITVIDQHAGTTTELVEESPKATPSEVDALLEKIKSHLPATKVMMISGTLAPGVPEDFCARCVAMANVVGARTILDAKGTPMKLALPHHPTLVKPNRSELESTLGHRIENDGQLLDAMRELHRLGAEWVLISAGRNQSLLTNGTEVWTITPPTLEAVNPIGSGDSLAAGIGVGLLRGQTMLEAMKLGFAAGCANVLTAYAAHVDPEDVQRLLPMIQLSKL